MVNGKVFIVGVNKSVFMIIDNDLFEAKPSNEVSVSVCEYMSICITTTN